jgi:hypothetical protein
MVVGFGLLGWAVWYNHGETRPPDPPVVAQEH